MLTRVYGTAFFSPKELEEHLERLERARANDHRRLGPQLGLFAFSEVSPGAAFWLPAGTEVFNELVALSREMGRPRGYTEVKTPQLYDSSLWKYLGPLGQVPRPHVRHRVRGPSDGAQADELPGPLPAVLAAAPLLPRPAGALLRAGAAAPPRAQRHAARPAARAPLRPGRRPHLLHRGPDPGRGHRAACEFAFATYEVFGIDVRLELSTRPEERIGSDELWDRQRGCAGAGARVDGPRVRPQRGRRRVLRPEDRHAHDRLARTARGSSAPCSSTTTCPSGSS